MFKKKVLSMAMVVCLLFSGSVTANAQVVDDLGIVNDGGIAIAPFYSYTNNTSTTLSVSGSGTATALANINGYSGTTTKVAITMTLQKKGGLLNLSWNDVTSWSQTFNSHSGTLSKTYSVSSGTYRVKAVYVAYSGSNSETITSYSGEVKY